MTYLDDEFKQLIGFLETFQHLINGDHNKYMSILTKGIMHKKYKQHTVYVG